MQGAYNRSIEDFIGNSHLNKMQKTLLNVIKKGDFSKIVKKQLSSRAQFDDSNINYAVKIPADADPINKQKRICKYEMQRQLLLRAAKSKPSASNGQNIEEQISGDPDTNFRVFYDLSKRLDKEFIPVAVERVLWASLNAKKKNAKYIPHFMDFERYSMNANVVLTTLPLRLREVIG